MNSPSVRLVESLWQRLVAGQTPHLARRDEDEVRAFLRAHCAFSVAEDHRFPLILCAAPTLAIGRSAQDITLQMSRAAPRGVFGLWCIDDQLRERLIVCWGAPHAARIVESTHGLTHLHEAFASALDRGIPLPSIGAGWWDLLDEEDVGTRFYRRIARGVREVREAWTATTTLSEDQRHELALLLIARLMFLRFIQHKNWLPSPAFMELLVEEPTRSVYQSHLQPLFFDALNRPVDARVSGVIPRSLPYLNGGLFAKTDIERAHPTLDLPNDVLRKLIREAFTPFHFVDAETHPRLDAIAPQMLGEVFERLMQPEERAQTGAFYTPRAICDAMVRDALSQALRPKLQPPVVEALLNETPLSPADAEDAANALLRLRIIDPAVGTGAFLMSAAQRLEAWYDQSIRPGLATPLASEDLRRHLISQSLFGIDIQPTAVLLTTLRLWLWLAAAQAPNAAPDPLPNLEHHIRCGDALIAHAPGKSAHAVELRAELGRSLTRFADARGEARQALLAHIETLERAITHEALHEQANFLKQAIDGQLPLFEDEGLSRKTLRAKHDAITRLLEAPDTMTRAGIFDPRLHFPHVMRPAVMRPDVMRPDATPPEGTQDHIPPADSTQAAGFDVVLGNPPWLALSKYPEPTRERLRQQFVYLRGGGLRSNSPDISLAFIELAESLITHDGVIALLIPSKALRASWGMTWRTQLRQRFPSARVETLPADGSHGFRASVYPTRILLHRGDASGDHRDGTPALHNPDVRGPLPLEAPQYLTIQDRYEVRYGIKTSANGLFLDPPEQGPLHAFTVPALRGRNLRPFETRGGHRLLFFHDHSDGEVLKELPPEARAWAQTHHEALIRRSDYRAQMPTWTLFRVRESTLRWRVVWRDVAPGLQAVVVPPVDQGGAVALNSAYYIAVEHAREAHMLCAWLNAEPASRWARGFAQFALNNHWRFDARTVGALPLPRALVVEQSAIAEELATLSVKLHQNPHDDVARAMLETCAEALWRELPLPDN